MTQKQINLELVKLILEVDRNMKTPNHHPQEWRNKLINFYHDLEAAPDEPVEISTLSAKEIGEILPTTTLKRFLDLRFDLEQYDLRLVLQKK